MLECLSVSTHIWVKYGQTQPLGVKCYFKKTNQLLVCPYLTQTCATLNVSYWPKCLNCVLAGVNAQTLV